MLPLVIVIIVFILFSVYLVARVINDIVYIAINVAILWVVLLRSYFEIRHKKIIIPYVIGLITSLIINLFWFDYIQIPKIFWTVWFITIMFLVAQLAQYLEPLIKKYEIDKKIKKLLKKIKK